MIIDLNGMWHIDSPKVEKLPVTIPGSVLSALLDNHLIDDPYYGENEASARAWLYYDYTFTRNFSLTAENLKNRITCLLTLSIQLQTSILTVCLWRISAICTHQSTFYWTIKF